MSNEKCKKIYQKNYSLSMTNHFYPAVLFVSTSRSSVWKLSALSGHRYRLWCSIPSIKKAVLKQTAYIISQNEGVSGVSTGTGKRCLDTEYNKTDINMCKCCNYCHILNVSVLIPLLICMNFVFVLPVSGLWAVTAYPPSGSTSWILSSPCNCTKQSNKQAHEHSWNGNRLGTSPE